MPKARYLVIVLSVALCGLLFSYSIPNEYVAQVKLHKELTAQIPFTVIAEGGVAPKAEEAPKAEAPAVEEAPAAEESAE